MNLKKAVTFERVFRIPFWFAYMDPDEMTWHWISALKAVEVGKLNKRDDDGEEFYWMKLKDFIQVKVSDDLGKLYIQRMPGYKKVKNFPVV